MYPLAYVRIRKTKKSKNKLKKTLNYQMIPLFSTAFSLLIFPLQQGDTCSCGETYGAYGTGDNCLTYCTGSYDLCGGLNMNHIYLINGTYFMPLRTVRTNGLTLSCWGKVSDQLCSLFVAPTSLFWRDVNIPSF